MYDGTSLVISSMFYTYSVLLPYIATTEARASDKYNSAFYYLLIFHLRCTLIGGKFCSFVPHHDIMVVKGFLMIRSLAQNPAIVIL